MVELSTVILAAGASKRLGFNKLSVRVDGEPVIRRTVRLFVEGKTGEITVVTGAYREKIEEELAGLPVRFFHNDHPEEGMSSSIRAALPVICRSKSVLFHLGDKPFVTPDALRRVLEASAVGRHGIIVAAYRGVKGHPVLMDMGRYLPAVSSVQGEGGLRDVVAGNMEDVFCVETDEGSVLDLDTENDMMLLRRRGYTIEKG
jgi:molybdenum cofactor cytidylyltransferase